MDVENEMSQKLVRIVINFTKPAVIAVDSLVKEGLYTSRQDTIRDALRRLLTFRKVHPFGLEAEE
ncbi:hypothetical protein ES703_35587 [subsurface metagenome]